MIRHFAEGARSEPVAWQDPLLTFNTACYSCHVSQLDTNYDLKTDTYNSGWTRPRPTSIIPWTSPALPARVSPVICP
jgi:hypothetical protein